jgi:murein L,D-transpeptidase YafK
MRPTQAAGGRIVLSGLIWLSGLSFSGSGLAAPISTAAVSTAAVSTAAVSTAIKVLNAPGIRGAIEKPDPDTLLIGVYKELGANHLRAAQLKADQLVEAYPNFRLGHLIRGDLLLMHTRQIKGFGLSSNAPTDKLNDLRDEAMVRLKSLRERPDPDLIPRAIMQLRDDQKYALVVDARQSRLYVYQHLNGHIKFMADYYISQGKFGINKLREGDQKTPIGVYYITGRLSRAKLPDFYGAGALPINYPNEWDKINGRSGSGIWLHGTPSGNYSRPPLASDGCVVLTNPDLEKLYLSVEIGKTPVVISEHVDFVNQTRSEMERVATGKLIEAWRRDTESKDTARLLINYSPRFKSSTGEDLTTWFAKSRPSLATMADLSVKLKDITLFRYPGQEEMIVSTFTQDNISTKAKSTFRKRQYWVKERTGWKIIYEANI